MIDSWSHIITGDGLRRSRLHNYKGDFIDLKGLYYLPHTIATTILFKIFGYRPMVPWLGWRTIGRLEHLIKPSWRVLEFGSGTSTIWFSQRCQQLVSIESDSFYFDELNLYFADHFVTNIDCRLAPLDKYASVDDFEDGYFDFILVDGVRRDECVRTALRKIKIGGYIYLDNSDVIHSNEYRIAEMMLLRAVDFDRRRFEYFNDFYPCYFGVNQGLLVLMDTAEKGR